MKDAKIHNWLARLATRDPELHRRIAERLSVPRAEDGRALESAHRPMISLETIVEEVGRPAIPIRGGTISYQDAFLDPRSEMIAERMKLAQERLEPLFPLVGRIDVANFWGNADFIGTGWQIEPGVIVTNRHVAQLVARRQTNRFEFRAGRFGDPMTVSVDYLHEMESDTRDSVDVERIIWIEEDPHKADIAFLKIADRSDGSHRNRIDLAPEDATAGDAVAVIGYPARGSTDDIPDQDRMDRIYGKRYDIKRIAPGTMEEDSKGWATHDCTTLGGNSGSAVVNLSRGEAVALHFAGLYMIENYAVPASTIRRYLKERPWEGGGIQAEQEQAAVSLQPAVTAVSAVGDRAEATARLTIPVTITVAIGGAGALAGGDTPGANGTDVDEAARLLWQERSGNGILSVRSSFLTENGRLIDKACIEVVAHPERLAEVRARVDVDRYLGFPVLIVAATVEEQLSPLGEAAVAESAATILYNDDDRTSDDFSLGPVEDEMEVTCHVGPERSWSELSRFLGGAKDELVSSIYQFHAGHIADLIDKELDERTRLMLVMDRKSRDPGDDEIKDGNFDRSETFDKWETKHHNRFDHIFVPTGRSGLVASSYHIKVTVRDEEALWLSSGNWKQSSQPKLPEARLDDARFVSRSGNREWHVILGHRKLAGRLRNHILADLSHSRDLGGRREAPFEAPVYVDVPADEIDEETMDLESSVPGRLLDPLTLSRKTRVTPLLTPDRRGAVYCEAVLELIESAERQLLFQIPYISPSISEASDGFPGKLMEALARKSVELDDFRLLLRSSVKKPHAVALKKRGFDLDKQVRQVAKHHTKGMVIDGERVLVGSHNWSGQGVTLNRDASLLFEDAEISGYYREAFEIDWTRARGLRFNNRRSESAARIATTPVPPPGFRRMLVDEFIED